MGPCSCEVGPDQCLVDRIEARPAGVSHRLNQLGLHDLEHSRHALRTAGAEAPSRYAAEADSVRPECESLEDIGPPPDAAIEQYRDAAVHRGDDLGELFQRGWR